MDEMVNEFLDDARQRMGKSVESARHEMSTVRTGRASPNLLDRIEIDYYGAQTPLKQMAQVAASDAHLLTITPYDKSSIGTIEKAIMESDLGLTPNNDGNVIRLAIPELNEERRKELVKVVHGVAEEGRVAVRNIRRDARKHLEGAERNHEISSDELDRAEKEMEKVTHEHVEKIDKALARKEHELLEV